MPLKETITNLDDVEESLRGLYLERDGEYVLDVEGEEPGRDFATVIREERKLRGAAESALKQLTRQLGVDDPAKAIEGLQRFRELEEKGLVGPGKWEAAVEKRAEEAVAALRAKEGALTAESQTLRARLEEVQLENGIHSAAAKAGVLPAAIVDLIPTAKNVWRLKDGKPVAMNGGEFLYSSSNPTEPMSMDEWIAERAKDRPHWFSAARPLVPQNGRQAGTVTLTREQAKDPAAYRTAKEQAEKAGGESSSSNEHPGTIESSHNLALEVAARGSWEWGAPSVT